MTDSAGDSDVSRETLRSLVSQTAFADLTKYADWLATAGTTRGLIGPRELPRLWSRHIANSAAVVLDPPDLVPHGATVIDVGSGAGLPGIVWGILRPDTTIRLVDSIKRRTHFLQEVVADLGMESRIQVIRARAEDLHGEAPAHVTTARAVAPLPRLLPWLAPLTAPGGCVLAMKGQAAESEVVDSRQVAHRLGLGPAEVVPCGAVDPDAPTRVVLFRRLAT